MKTVEAIKVRLQELELQLQEVLAIQEDKNEEAFRTVVGRIMNQIDTLNWVLGIE